MITIGRRRLTPGDQILKLDRSGLHLMPGTIFSCRLAAVDSWVGVFIHLFSENREKGMDIYLLHLLTGTCSVSAGRGSL